LLIVLPHCSRVSSSCVVMIFLVPVEENTNYLICIWTVGGNQTIQRKPTKHGENMQTPCTQRRESSPDSE
ncbi:hypothetical protein DAT39_007671, partial [Clarias magur]